MHTTILSGDPEIVALLFWPALVLGTLIAVLGNKALKPAAARLYNEGAWAV